MKNTGRELLWQRLEYPAGFGMLAAMLVLLKRIPLGRLLLLRQSLDLT